MYFNLIFIIFKGLKRAPAQTPKKKKKKNPDRS